MANHRVIPRIIQANLIHLSIKMNTPHQSGAPFVGERVFQNRGVCGQAFPLSSHHHLLRRVFALARQFTRGQNAKSYSYGNAILLHRLLPGLHCRLIDRNAVLMWTVTYVWLAIRFKITTWYTWVFLPRILVYIRCVWALSSYIRPFRSRIYAFLKGHIFA